jgi:hypothetical protein
MKKIISFKLAGDISIVILILLIVFHILVMVGIIPHTIVWGGRIEDGESLLTFELFGLVTSLLFLFIILAKVEYLKFEKFRKVVTILVWIMFVWFLLNIVGNLISTASLEKLIFTPVSIILTVLVLRLAVEK